MLGFVDQFQSARLQSILSQSWILVNTSVREGLPTSFLEALANQRYTPVTFQGQPVNVDYLLTFTFKLQ